MVHKVEINGEQVEVYTAAERQADIDAAKAEVEGQYKPKLTAAETEAQRLSGLLDTRSREFEGARTEFKRLTDEQKGKLSATELALYQNQEVLATERESAAKTYKAIHDSAVDVAIRARTGSNEEVFKKVKEMYALINLEDLTPEQIATRVNAAVGAIGTTERDLLAGAGFAGGGFEAPSAAEDTKAITPKQAEIAKNLGIALTEEELRKQMGNQ